jgi:hypothetical protein
MGCYFASAFIRAFTLPDKPHPVFGRRAPFVSRTASNWSYCLGLRRSCTVRALALGGAPFSSAGSSLRGAVLRLTADILAASPELTPRSRPIAFMQVTALNVPSMAVALSSIEADRASFDRLSGPCGAVFLGRDKWGLSRVRRPMGYETMPGRTPRVCSRISFVCCPKALVDRS